MTDSYIELNNASLDYFHYLKRHNLKKTVLNSILALFTGKKEQIITLKRALDGIHAKFVNGDRIALIGKNGSGKSTLLRVLSGIYKPTSGFIKIHGKISSLIDISVGLNCDATGYENIILMGLLHGKTRKYMKSKFEDIEQFTELKEYLTLPVRTYSSGMRLRLAFAVATCMDSEIIVIDEVIGVGDQSFIEKAQKRFKDLIHKSQILVITSHTPQILRQFCNKAMVLQQGKCTFFGDLEEGIKLYDEVCKSSM